MLRMSLLRAATAPDAEQDQGGFDLVLFKLIVTMLTQTHRRRAPIFLGGHAPRRKLPGVGRPRRSLHLQLALAQCVFVASAPFPAAWADSACAVRYVPKMADTFAGAAHKPAFMVDGAPNVFLETVKRGDDDDLSATARATAPTVVLRLFEAYGGHARVKLRIPARLNVAKVALTNLLEDEGEEIRLYEEEVSAERVEGYEKYLVLEFHGFEVKTVKLTIGSEDAKKIVVQR